MKLWHFVVIAVMAGLIGNLAYDLAKHAWYRKNQG